MANEKTTANSSYGIPEKDSFHSSDFREMPHQLDYLKEIRGIGVFTARPSIEKSYCLRYFAKSINPNLHHMVYLFLSTIFVAKFYKQFYAVLGLIDKDAKRLCLKPLRNRFIILQRKTTASNSCY